MTVAEWHKNLQWPVDLDTDLYWDVNGVIDFKDREMVYFNYAMYQEIKNSTPEEGYKLWCWYGCPTEGIE